MGQLEQSDLSLKELYHRFIAALETPTLQIPTTGVKFYRHDQDIPSEVLAHQPTSITLTSCQAAKQASLGDAVLLTLKNVGCIAAAISFGLVDQDQPTPLSGPRVYTDIMQQQSGTVQEFTPPTPRDFTEGLVYACRAANRQSFGLFGKEDSGRFHDVKTAKAAISEMMAIQPAVMKGVFFYSLDFDDLDLTPDVVVMSVRPVELTRIVQAYQFLTGRRVTASMGGLRAVSSDLVVQPYLTQEINISPYCLGSRLIAQYEANRLGIGLPFEIFKQVVEGAERSRTGFPFHAYPGAAG